MLGGKFRDKIRCYADTTESEDPKIYGQRLEARKEQGFTWLKMDPGIDVLRGQQGMVTHPASVPGDGSNANLGQGRPHRSQRGKERASHRAGTAGLVAAAH
jgi:hypothetical protein